jgi:hypothetical protein
MPEGMALSARREQAVTGSRVSTNRHLFAAAMCSSFPRARCRSGRARVVCERGRWLKGPGLSSCRWPDPLRMTGRRRSFAGARHERARAPRSSPPPLANCLRSKDPGRADPRASTWRNASVRCHKACAVYCLDDRNAHLQGFEKRMMGLEPTTFCMARTDREATGDAGRRHPA